MKRWDGIQLTIGILVGFMTGFAAAALWMLTGPR
jgi:hypothetical protein